MFVYVGFLLYFKLFLREIYLSWHSDVAWKCCFAKSDWQPSSYELSVDLTGKLVLIYIELLSVLTYNEANWPLLFVFLVF